MMMMADTRKSEGMRDIERNLLLKLMKRSLSYNRVVEVIIKRREQPMESSYKACLVGERGVLWDEDRATVVDVWVEYGTKRQICGHDGVPSDEDIKKGELRGIGGAESAMLSTDVVRAD